MYEMLVSELKADLFSLKVKSEAEDYEYEENANEVIANDRTITHEQHNVENMKSFYVGEGVVCKEIAEIVKDKLKSK